MQEFDRKPIFDHVGPLIGGWNASRIADMDAAIDQALGIEPPKPEKRQLIDEEAFFKIIRHRLFGGSITESQLAGIRAKLTAFGEAGWSIAYAAYAMETSYHETAQSMQPVEEGYYISKDWKKAEAWRRKNLRYFPWYGRGDVQLTWERNYRKADSKLGLGGALLANPRMALLPDISAQIMVRGMTEGWFTKYALADFLPDERGTERQFKQCRRIINGTDKWEKIAKEAMIWQDAFVAGRWS